jgi:AcrR family transcriptional regulator
MKLTDLKMQEKEKKILDAAIAVISEKGFSASSTSEIAHMAGVAEGTIFRYFKTKKDILRGILIHMVNILGEPLMLDSFKKILFSEDQKDLRAIIKAFLKERFALIDAIYPMLRIVVTEALYHEDIRKILYESIISKSLEIFKQFQEEMVAKGLMNKDIDPMVATRSISGNFVGFFIYRKFFGPMTELEDFDRDLDRVVDIIMYGIAPR